MAFDRPGFDREVGLRLQLARKRREITQAELAKKIGLPRASYANLESGRQRIPVDILWRAAVILDVPISSLVPEPLNRRSPRDSVLLPTSRDLFGSSSKAAERIPDTEISLSRGVMTSFPAFHDPSVLAWSNTSSMLSSNGEEDDG